MKNRFLTKYILAFIGVLSALMLALWLSTKLPQNNIDINVAKSYERLSFEGEYAHVLDSKPSSLLDNYTDAITLTVCKSSNPTEEKAFLTNPFFEEPYVLDALGRYCRGEAEPYGHYVRYWIGSRIFLRPLLEVMDLQYIRYFTIAVLFCMLFAAFMSVCRRVSARTGIAFLISMLLIRPYICARCMQFACCPLIALTAFLTVPVVEKRPPYYPVFFMTVGIVTMFFDFYTVPILTFGLPMIYLMAIRAKKGLSMSVKNVLGCFAGWGAGYFLTWITKLVLVELFTEYKGFTNGFDELFMWLGKSPDAANTADAFVKEFAALRSVIVPDTETGIIMAVLALAVIAALMRNILKGNWHELRNNMAILAVGLFPLLWFAVAKYPTTRHAFFQYRSVAVIYWAIGAWVLGPEMWSKKNKKDC